MTAQKKLLIMAGGTGGHIFPAIAVAEYLKQKGWHICWVGTQDRLEAKLVPQHNIEIKFIQISGLKGKGITSLLLAPFRILRAIFQAKTIIRKYQPDAVLGMGGYVSGPTGIAAKICSVPIILHEQNAVAGLTNKWLHKISTYSLQAFPNALPLAQVVGNPVRNELFALLPPAERLKNRTEKLRILVLGGSQGAMIINQLMPAVVFEMKHKIEAIHQVGKGSLEKIQALYQANDPVTVTEFIEDMSHAYSWADIVICRSGALTVSEIAAVGLGAIFIPFQHKDNQQYLNAKQLSDIGAAKIILQSELSVDKLTNLLNSFTHCDLLKMAIKAQSIATPLATEKVAEAVISCAKTNHAKS